MFRGANDLDHLQNMMKCKFMGTYMGKRKSHQYIFEPQLTRQLWWLGAHISQQVKARTPGRAAAGGPKQNCGRREPPTRHHSNMRRRPASRARSPLVASGYRAGQSPPKEKQQLRDQEGRDNFPRSTPGPMNHKILGIKMIWNSPSYSLDPPAEETENQWTLFSYVTEDLLVSRRSTETLKYMSMKGRCSWSSTSCQAEIRPSLSPSYKA